MTTDTKHVPLSTTDDVKKCKAHCSVNQPPTEYESLEEACGDPISPIDDRRAALEK